MKISRKTLKQNPALLDSFNERQDDSNRQESLEVKRCFNNQIQQTIIASTAILSVAVSIMADKTNWYVLSLISLFIIVLCLLTVHVGCHKYNTSNRALAYQIHLSRISDYEEFHLNKKGSLIAFELRRINWEEAMFAWRIVQPVIYNYFYKVRRRNKILKKEENKKDEKKIESTKFVNESLKTYPWVDTQNLIETMNRQEPDSSRANFYPGRYLRKMLYVLYSLIVLLIILFSIGVYKVGIKKDWQTINLPNELLLGGLLALASLSLFLVIRDIIICFHKCKKLESGLLSIQTGAFVWRIVCITSLLAKYQAISNNRKKAAKNQIYNGYTKCLAFITCNDLFFGLHEIHEWLEKKENELIRFIK